MTKKATVKTKLFVLGLFVLFFSVLLFACDDGTFTVSKNEVDLKVGQNTTIEITPEKLSEKIEWSAENPDVATVDDGIITGTGAGETVITARYGKNSQKIAVTVSFIVVTFNTQGGSEIEPAQLEYGKKVVKPENPEKEGCTFENWYVNSALTELYDFNQEVTSDLTLYAKWDDIKFNVTFMADGETYGAIEVIYGKKVEEPKEPEKEGYTFAGWYTEENDEWIFAEDIVLADMILVAKWTANQYLVTLDAGAGTVDPDEVLCTYDQTVSFPEPEWEDHIFLGWYYNGELIEDGVWKITSDITLTAYYVQALYNVHYDLNYEDKTTTAAAGYGEPFTPMTPERTGYTFVGWYDENDNLFAGFEVWELEGDLHLKAAWEANIYTITLDLNGGSLDDELTFEVTFGEQFTKPADPVMEGYTFDGWYRDDDKWVFGTYNVASDIILKAKWTANQYLVTLDAGAGTVDPDEVLCTYDQTVNFPKPEWEDHIFLGWYYNETLIEDGVWKIASDITLTAYYVQTHYNVHYDLNHDGLTTTVAAGYGEPFTPMTPERAGYVFVGWYDENDNLFAGFEVWELEEDLYLKAAWEAGKFTITLDLNGGSLSGELTYEVTFGETFVLPVPQSGREPFFGWYYDEERMTDKNGESLVAYLIPQNATFKADYSYEIDTAQGLIDIKNNLGASYKLIGDIDISGIEWIPIGTIENQFTGMFDGQGYTISGLTITNSHQFTGLFGCHGGTIKNVILDNVNVNITNASGTASAGSLVGYSRGVVINVLLQSGSIKSNSYFTGGIIGTADNEGSGFHLENLVNNCEVTGSSVVGGLIGVAGRYFKEIVIITNSHNTGKISGELSVGGLVGMDYDVLTIRDSYNTGEIRGKDYAGGLIGYGYPTIINSHNSGKIYGKYAAGGLAAFTIDIVVSNSYNTGEINGSSVGGLVGRTVNATISSSYNTGEVSADGSGDAGGLIGNATYESKITITNSYNAGNVSGDFSVGGFIGSIHFETEATIYVANSINFGDVSAKSSDVGGIIGADIINKEEDQVYYTGRVTHNNQEIDGIPFGTKVTDLTIFNETFFVEGLGWDTEVWDFTNLDVASGIYPTLK